MPRSALTGSRIRERRMDLGIKQSQLAEACGVSASYLNLIEHNRRRIGGKLLIDLARELSVEVAALSEGADLALVEELRAAAADSSAVAGEVDRVEEFAGRFPGWAKLVAEQGGRIAALRQAIETLSDRLTHDPFLSESLHEILSTAASVRSTSAILAEETEIDPAWRARFHRNLHEDSQRLAESSRALAAYLDAGADVTKSALSPQEEFEFWLERIDYRPPGIEEGQPAEDDIFADTPELASASSRALARAYQAQCREDAVTMPEVRFHEAVATHGLDPTRLAQVFEAEYAAVFRRLALLPHATGGSRVGLVICDGSGAIVFRKPIAGFPLPRFGSACPLWPLFQALTRPATPIRQIVELSGRTAARFLTHAIAESEYPGGFDAPPVTRSYMLIQPADDDTSGLVGIVGTSCRICPRESCAARRELSILGGESAAGR